MKDIPYAIISIYPDGRVEGSLDRGMGVIVRDYRKATPHIEYEQTVFKSKCLEVAPI